jgi:phage-related minor tail protein
MGELLDDFRDELGDSRVELERIEDLARGVSRSLSSAFRGAVVDGRSLNSVLAQVARSFSDIALQAAFKPVGLLVGGLVEDLFKGAKPFAKGGVIAAPSYFPMGQGLGVAGEAGPEAILPLARGSDGRLGVAAGGGGGAVNVTMNITASDARSFVASEAEVSAMLLRAVRRGARAS